MKSYEVVYRVGNTYKFKIVHAETADKAIRKARIKNIIDLICIDDKQIKKD